MSKEKNRLGSDPLGWIRPTREEPSEAPKTIEELSKDAQPQKKQGDPELLSGR